MSAVVTTYLFGLVTSPLTGTYYFFDSYIPIAVFLGMHLLFTDPSTAPRTELGRIIFGALYGLSTVALYALLGTAGLPDLLRQAAAGAAVEPVGQGDRSGRCDPTPLGPIRSGPAHGVDCRASRRNLAYISVWAMVFTADERRRRASATPSRPMAALLAARLRRRPPGRVPPPGADVRNLLPCRLSVVVPRVHVDGPGCG